MEFFGAQWLHPAQSARYKSYPKHTICTPTRLLLIEIVSKLKMANESPFLFLVFLITPTLLLLASLALGLPFRNLKFAAASAIASIIANDASLLPLLPCIEKSCVTLFRCTKGVSSANNREQY
jgi:hypothetical protein